MERPKIVIDTNVLIAALQSRRGASFKLLSSIGHRKFIFARSVPLVLEDEVVAACVGISATAINAILDRLCFYGECVEIFFLWRPYLPDVEDEMILELALNARCRYIITYNVRHFQNLESLGIQVVTPKEFFEHIGETVRIYDY